MKNNEQTIEEFYVSRTSGDLWDEINSDANLNPNSLIQYLPPNVKTTFRFLGPFVYVQRFYAPFLRYCKNIDIEAVANKDPKAIQDVIRIIRENNNYQLDKATILKYLQELPNQMTWQKCIMVNVYSKAFNVKVMGLTRKLCDSILTACNGRNNIVLSGFLAHNIIAIKRGAGMNITFDIKIDNKTAMSQNEMNAILSRGLIDIPTLIQESNKTRKSSYYYKMPSSYKMPSEFMDALIKERIPIEEDQHLINTEEHLDEIPVEAFERRNSFRSAIGSLEV